MAEHEVWVVADGDGDILWWSARTDPGASKLAAVQSEKYPDWEQAASEGYTCRRVRITEITDDQS